jgi:hypothetical protein
MAFYTKIRAIFIDILGDKWQIDIQGQGEEQGAITEYTCTDNPLMFEWYGSDDILTQSIIGSKVSLTILSYIESALSELYTSDNLEFKVIVYFNEVECWSGYVLPESHNEPYDGLPIAVTIASTDALGLLKEFNFSDLGYTSRQKLSVIIYDILSLVGITTFTEYMNIYNANMSDTVDDSPLDQLGIDPYVFQNNTCYEALEKILGTFNAGIRQDGDIFTIYRFVELKDATMYGRVFTSGTSKTSTTKSTVQYIDRTAQSSAFWDVEGGNLGMLPQLKRYIINYDLGLKPSVLKNWQFNFDDFVEDEGTYTIDGWTAYNCVISPISTLISGEESGIYLDADAVTATNQLIGQYVEGVKQGTAQFKIKYKAKIKNSDIDPVTVGLHYRLFVDPDEGDMQFWVRGSGTQFGIGTEWSTNSGGSPSNTYTVFDNVQPGWNDWVTVEILVDTIPVDGNLGLHLFAANSTGGTANVVYKDIELVMTPAEGSEQTGIGYTIECGSTGKIKEVDAVLGDGFTSRRYTINQMLNFSGIMNNYSGESIIDPSTVWHTRGNTENKALHELIGEEIGTQYEQTRQLIDLPMYEMESGARLSSIGTLVDVLHPSDVFFPSVLSFNARDRAYQLVLTQIH